MKLGFIIAASIALAFYACCRVSGECSRQEEAKLKQYPSEEEVEC